MSLRYLSVCSGIEAASVAWRPFAFEPVAFSEIEPFPSAVLAHHYPHVPNWGDMTRFQEWPDADVDVLVGGTPCQSFSVAGLRKGLADPRGNLALVYLGIVDRYRPEWVAWENVPGVLSQDGGRAFGAFLGGLAELGYGFAYRVLDAQYVRVDGFGRAVPQRRRRVFVVGCLGDWRRAAAVLFERESLSGHPAPRREARERAAPTIGGGPDGGRISGNVSSKWAKGSGGPAGDELYNMVAQPFAPAISASNPYGDHESREGLLVAHALCADGFDASEDGTGRGTPLVPVAFNWQGGGTQTSLGYDPEAGVAGTLGAEQTPAIAFDAYNFAAGDVSPTMAGLDAGNRMPHAFNGWAVRRLTPTECERLQGFLDGYTDIAFRKKPASDGPRYKALGNSMAVNVMRWIGHRIDLVHRTIDRAAA